jgi:predicted small lipoprotein YifL
MCVASDHRRSRLARNTQVKKMNVESKARFALLALLASGIAGTLAGCGQKGPLYLPDQATGVVTRPTQTPPEPPTDSVVPNSPRTIDDPVAPANPAPEVTAPEEGDKKKNVATAPPTP